MRLDAEIVVRLAESCELPQALSSAACATVTPAGKLLSPEDARAAAVAAAMKSSFVTMSPG
ncbi:MAG: hypothetical protein ACRD24_07870 [Terriglobales bacterium]